MIQTAYRVETSKNEGKSVSGRQVNYLKAGWMEHTLSVDPPFVSVRRFQLNIVFTLKGSTGYYESQD
jgi:hypothetical protein